MPPYSRKFGTFNEAKMIIWKQEKVNSLFRAKTFCNHDTDIAQQQRVIRLEKLLAPHYPNTKQEDKKSIYLYLYNTIK